MEVVKDFFNTTSLDILMQAEGIEGVAQSFESEYNISLDEEKLFQLFVCFTFKICFLYESVFI